MPAVDATVLGERGWRHRLWMARDPGDVMSTDAIVSDASLAISGLFILAAAVLLVARLRLRRQARQHWSLSELCDLSRSDIDPHWQAIKNALPGCARDTEPPPEWDPCVVREPKDPQRGDEDR
jgi:hypothetical protein